MNETGDEEETVKVYMCC